MRIINVKRGYSLRALLPFERREFVGQVPLSTPYYQDFLADRLRVYNEAVSRRMTIRQYADWVRDWYAMKGYGDVLEASSAWIALRDYQANWKLRNPDAVYGSPAGHKSHHNPYVDKTKLRQQRADYRRKNRDRINRQQREARQRKRNG